MATRPTAQKTTRQKQTQQFWALVQIAGPILKKDLRSPEDVERLLQALRIFKDSKDNAEPLPQQGASNQAIFSTPVTALSLKESEALWLRRRGIRLIGELYYVQVRARRTKPTLIERFRTLIKQQYGLPTDITPLACGWRPPYWDDPAFLATLNMPVIDALGQETKPDEGYRYELKLRSQFAARYPNSYRTVTPDNATSARRLHLNGKHYIGSVLQRKQEQYTLNIDELTSRQQDVRPLETIWGGALVPPEWTPPKGVPASWRREARIVRAERRVYKETLNEYRKNQGKESIFPTFS